MAARRRWDWPQVALVAVVGGIAVAALVALDIDADKIASIPPGEWLLIAGTISGVIGTVGAALRRAMVENSAPSTPVRHIRSRDTEPPEAP